MSKLQSTSRHHTYAYLENHMPYTQQLHGPKAFAHQTIDRPGSFILSSSVVVASCSVNQRVSSAIRDSRMVVVYAAPGAISDASRNNDRNHTLPGNRSLERSFRYQAPDPSVFSDFLYVGSGGVSASYSPVTSSTQTNQNESHDKEDTMGARESKVSSPPNFRYLPTNPDIFKLPEDEPDSQAPDQGPEYVFMFGSLTSLQSYF